MSFRLELTAVLVQTDDNVQVNTQQGPQAMAVSRRLWESVGIGDTPAAAFEAAGKNGLSKMLEDIKG